MNIAVINVKDLFKYILKFFIIFFFLLLLTRVLKIKENINVAKTIKTNTSKLNGKVYTECIDLSISLMSYKNQKNNTNKSVLSGNKILAIQTGILDKKSLKESNINTPKEEIVEAENKREEIPKEEVVVESVSENNIEPKFNCSYNGVKIDNQSDYDITEDMLIPDEEITNKKDILIYHTHTCESYTPSERI